MKRRYKISADGDGWWDEYGRWQPASQLPSKLRRNWNAVVDLIVGAIASAVPKAVRTEIEDRWIVREKLALTGHVWDLPRNRKTVEDAERRRSAVTTMSSYRRGAWRRDLSADEIQKWNERVSRIAEEDAKAGAVH